MRLLASLVAAASLVSSTQAEPTLFLADSTFDFELTRVYVVDPATGSMTLRADLGSAYTPVLAMAAADADTLYLVGSDLSCGGARSCLLMKVELDPLSATPLSVTTIGPVTAAGTTVVEIVGLTFDRQGRLWASSQDGGGLYLVNPETAAAVLVGMIDVEVHGGDVSFDRDDRLWLWSNIGTQTGRYELDPNTASATAAEIHPGLEFAGLASLGHGTTLFGAGPLDDRLHAFDVATGRTGISVPLSLGGSPFDHKRGDLDSPWCESDAGCGDDDACTADSCSPGGCLHVDDPFVDADGDGRADCGDSCPGTIAGELVDAAGCTLIDRCPCDAEWASHGAYVSCVAGAASEIFGFGRDRGRAVRTAARSECGGTFKRADVLGLGNAPTRAPRER